MTNHKTIYVTLSGLPLSFHLEWPFRKSTSGADFFFLHADILLENSAGLHAPVAVNLSATVREVMPSLEAQDAQSPIINSLRKEVDHKQIEFVKSGKLVPMNFSSRHWDFKRSKWVFGKASDEDILQMLARKVYWQARLVGGTVWLGDPTESLYLESTPAHLLELAQRLEGQKLITLTNNSAVAEPMLMDRAEQFESDMRTALDALEKKHAYERG